MRRPKSCCRQKCRRTCVCPQIQKRPVEELQPKGNHYGRPRDPPKNHSRMDGPSEGQATDRRTGGGIRQKGGTAKRVPSQSARPGSEISARPFREGHGMAVAARGGTAALGTTFNAVQKKGLVDATW